MPFGFYSTFPDSRLECIWPFQGIFAKKLVEENLLNFHNVLQSLQSHISTL